MTDKSGVVWVRPPAALAKAIEQYGERAWVGVEAVCRRWAAGRQNAARQNASWEDRTGNARTGLYADVERLAKAVTVILAHTMEYGKYLELDHGGRYAIIMKTLEEGAPELEQMLRDLVG